MNNLSDKEWEELVALEYVVTRNYTHNLKKELSTLFEKLSTKHDVNMDHIHISWQYGAIYIHKVKYNGLSGRNEYELLEIIE